MSDKIFKVQRPLYSTQANAPCLVYSEGGDDCFEQNFGPDAMERLFGKRKFGQYRKPKVYVSGRIENNRLVFDKVVPDQPW